MAEESQIVVQESQWTDAAIYVGKKVEGHFYKSKGIHLTIPEATELRDKLTKILEEK